MKTLKVLNTTKIALVDDDDYDRCLLYKWILRGYVVCVSNNEYYGHLSLANYIMRTRKLMYDHKDRDHFNNQKDNLRLATKQQNNCNKEKYDGTYTSKYKGVSWFKTRKTWRACIYYGGQISLGYFKNEKEAARAYDKAALKYHKEFAVLNFPKEIG